MQYKPDAEALAITEGVAYMTKKGGTINATELNKGAPGEQSIYNNGKIERGKGSTSNTPYHFHLSTRTNA